MNKGSTGSGQTQDAIFRFTCSVCETPLIVSGSKDPVSGPCPKCEAWIQAEQFQKTDGPAINLSARVGLPSKGSRSRSRAGSNSSRGRIRADGFLDHNFNERRELFGTLRVLAVALAVLAVILFVALYMKQWIEN